MNFYKSRAWKRKRKYILKRDGYRCQLAKRYGRNLDANTVHHIYPLDEYPQYALCDWNLIAVSQEANNRLHDRKTGKLTQLGLDLMRRTKAPDPPS